jgi:hypothetical protein
VLAFLLDMAAGTRVLPWLRQIISTPDGG